MRLSRILAFVAALSFAAPALAQTNPGTSPLSGAKGGTNNAFMQFSGPATSMKTYTLPNASGTVGMLNAIATWTAAQSFSDGTVILLGSSSGSSTIKAPATGGGTATLFPGTDTIAGVATAQALTNKTFNCANNTCTVRIASDVTGLGTGIATALGVNVGSAGAPVINGGALGTPSSGTLTSATGLPLGSGVTGTLPIANNCPGSTGANSSTFLRGDCTWATPAGGGNVSTSGTPTNHQIGSWVSSTQIQGIGPGTVGQALVSNGPSADASYQSGGWVLLNTLTASASATLDDTTSLTSTYTEYEIVFKNLIPATNNDTCSILVHSGGAFKATGYLTSAYGNTNGGAMTFLNTSTAIPCSFATAVGSGGGGVVGKLHVATPSAAAFHNIFGEFTYATGSTTQTRMSVGSQWNTSGAIDGFRFQYTGNTTSGTIEVYGRL